MPKGWPAVVGLQTQRSASLGPGAVWLPVHPWPVASSPAFEPNSYWELTNSECKSRPGLSRFADQNWGLNSRKPFAVSRRRTAAVSLSSGCPVSTQASTHDGKRSMRSPDNTGTSGRIACRLRATSEVFRSLARRLSTTQQPYARYIEDGCLRCAVGAYNLIGASLERGQHRIAVGRLVG